MSGGALGSSFGRVAATYDRVRRPYSNRALDRAAEALDLGPGAAVLDLAAGTGTLSRSLAARFPGLVAVEPDHRMRALLRGVETAAGSAESIPFGDGSFDAVFVGDAFHWFDPDRAVDEIARVLRPGGGLALLWNSWWDTEPPVPDAAYELLREPFERSGRAAEAVKPAAWRAAFADSAFGPLRDEEFPGEFTIGRDELVELYLTTSSIAVLAESEREELARGLRSLLADTYRVPLVCELVWTRLDRTRPTARR